MGRKGYPAEFRRRAVSLLQAGKSVRELADELGVSEQTLYTWRRQDRIDRGELQGIKTKEHAELYAARRRIRELETELQVHRRATELLRGNADPKPDSQSSD
jgi:transposase-like protein